MRLHFFKNLQIKLISLSLGICSILCIVTINGHITNSSLEKGNWIEAATLNELEIRMKGPLKQDNPDLIQHLIKRVLVPPSNLPYNFSNDKIYIKSSQKFDSRPIKRCLKSLFQNTTKGFFVEAGALDGEYLSNSLWLEQILNWTGLLVEPDGLNYRDLVWKRRKAWLSNSCLSNEKFPQELVLVSTRKKKDVIMPPMIMKESSFTEDFVNITENKFYLPLYRAAEYSYIRCPSFPLYTNLLALNISIVDFLSLDIQGVEMNIFNTIPLEKIFIRSFVIEYAQQKINYNLIKYFNNLGFDLFSASHIGSVYFFINRNDTKLIEKGKSLGMAQRFIDGNIVFEFAEIPFGESLETILKIHDELKNGNYLPSEMSWS